MITVKKAKEMGVVFVEGDVVKDEDGVAYNESWYTNETGLFDDCQVTSFTDRKHTGDEMPCDGKLPVVVYLYRGGEQRGRNAGEFNWLVEGVDGDINSWKPNLEALGVLANKKEEKPMKATRSKRETALVTLERLGYAFKGGELWEPPVVTPQKQYAYELVTDLTPTQVIDNVLNGSNDYFFHTDSEYKQLDKKSMLENYAQSFVRKEIETVTRTITYPKPVSDPLNEGEAYWLVTFNGVISSSWENSWLDPDRMKQGRIHLTKENAQAHWDALFGERNESNENNKNN